MKKILFILLIITLALSVFLLPACSSKDDAQTAIEYTDPEDVTSDTFLFYNTVGDDAYRVSARKSVDMPARIVIPSTYNGKPVVSIEDHAFKGHKTIKEVVIPPTVKSISLSAFYGCSALETITIPASVTSIAYLAFYACNHLQSITFQGTQKQWNAIEKEGAFGSIPTVHCTDGDI